MSGDMITYSESKKIVLSDNFTLDEFLYSETAVALGIDNSMPRSYLPRIQYLVDTVLQPVRDRFGPIKITSGFRNPVLSVKIGSSIHSNHCFGFAADIEPYDKTIPLLDILVFINDNLNYKELIAEHFNKNPRLAGWVHVAAQDGNNKQELKLLDNEHFYSRVDIDYISNIYAA